MAGIVGGLPTGGRGVIALACLPYPLEISYIPCYHAIMVQSFAAAATEDIYNGRNTKRARRTCPREIWAAAARKLDQLDSAEALKDLRVPPGNRLELLRGAGRGITASE